MRIIVMDSAVVHRVARSTRLSRKGDACAEGEDAGGAVRGRRANAPTVPRTGHRLSSHCRVWTAKRMGQLVWDWM